MEFRILGPLEVVSDGAVLSLGGVKPRVVLAVLLLDANEVVSTERLALALWGQEAPAGAIRTAQVHVSRLRKALGGAGMLETMPGGYRLRVSPEQVDVERFERLAADGQRALAAGDGKHAATMLREALALWRGPPLADLGFRPFAQAAIRRLEEQRLSVLEARVEADLAAGCHGALVIELQQLVDTYPARERLAGLLMLALYRCGRQVDALDAYQRARRALVEAFGVEPGPALLGLHDAILHQDASLDASSGVPELPAELVAATATVLWGRQPEVEWLRQRWQSARAGAGALVTVIGPRGIGKTRLVAELAREAQRDGATVLYVAGSGPAADALASLSGVCEATRLTLFVLDDADKADVDVLGALRELTPMLATHAVLVLATGEDAPALACLGERVLCLEALDDQAVRSIAVGYAWGHASADVPIEWLLDVSGGVPAEVHEAARQWARREAARRVGRGAMQAASGRAELRSIERELAADVVELHARDRDATDDRDATPVVCPFKGLVSFDVVDAPYFFGRERLVGELVARLVGAPLLGVVGASGSGKSSAVRAGLLPALAAGVLPGSEDRWQIVMRPGEHPRRGLHDAMHANRDAPGLLLFVDQFEETFTACRDQGERAAFIAELTALAADRDGRCVVVLAIRSDFYGRCATYPALSSLLAANHVLVGPMRREELGDAIKGPTARASLRIEPALVHALIADVADEPGALPLLSTALLELWQRRDRRCLRHAAYLQTGGVRGAVARLAEDAFAQLNGAQQTVARSVLLRLVQETEPATVERRRVSLTELDIQEDGDAAHVIALLTDRRLLTISSQTIEVAHEALLREWPRLRDWIEEAREGLRIHRRLTVAAQEWQRLSHDDETLYRGVRLTEAREWASAHGEHLSRLEREFLAASQATELSQLEAAKRRTHRLRVLATGLATLAVLIAAIAVWALDQRAQAQRERVATQRQALVARSLALTSSASALFHTRPDISLLLGLEAYRTSPRVEARSSLLAGLIAARDHGVRAMLHGHTSSVERMAFSPDGRTLASTSTDTIRLWDPRTHKQLGMPLRGHTAPIISVAFSTDGRTLTSASLDHTIRVWDIRTHKQLRAPLTVQRSGRIELSPDGRTASVSYAKTIRVWDVRTHKQLGAPLSHTDVVLAVAFSPDGRTLASASFAKTIRLWDLRAHKPLGPPLSGHTDYVYAVAFTADGRTLASASADNTIRLWDLRTHKQFGTPLPSRTHNAACIAFSPDGHMLASSFDKKIALRDLRTHKALGPPLTGHTRAVNSVAFSPDGHTLASASADNTIRLWDVRTHKRMDRALAHDKAFVESATFSPDASILATFEQHGTSRALRLRDGLSDKPLGPPLSATRHATRHAFNLGLTFSADSHRLATTSGRLIRVWDISTHKQLGPPLTSHGTWYIDVALSPDGRTLASANDEGIRLWELRTHKQIGPPMIDHSAPKPRSLAFSPDGRTLAITNASTIHLWDVPTHRLRAQPLRGHTSSVYSVAFSPDGRTLASTSEDKTLRLWDVRTDKQLGGPLSADPDIFRSVAFSPDGRTLASTSQDGTLRLWDTHTHKQLGIPLSTPTPESVAVAFRPDGRTLLSVSPDATIQSWNDLLWRTHAELQTKVCNLVANGLSNNEWVQYAAGTPYRNSCP
jgi:WD40 repeat protein/DNA-binding SARP family transcriptional activator